MDDEDELIGAPPPVSAWATRADLLRDRSAALDRLHHADLSLRTVVLTTLITAVAVGTGVAIPLPFLASDDGTLRVTSDLSGAEAAVRGIGTAILSVVAAGLYWWALRRALQARRVGKNLKAWQDAADTAEARALPRGDLPRELREPFDARPDPDFDDHASVIVAKMYADPFDKRVMARSVPAGIMLPVGFTVAVLGGDPDLRPLLTGCLFGGLVLFYAASVQITKVVNRSFRATRRWKRYQKEYQRWSAECAADGVWAQSVDRQARPN